MPRIGIDYTAAVQQAAGIGRYVRELITALMSHDCQHQYRLFAASEKRFQAPFPVTRLPFHDKWLMRMWHRVRLPLPVELFTGRLDLFHSPDFTLPPTLPGTRTLLTVHDLSFIKDPESADSGLRKYLNQVVPRSVRRADHILADSQATKIDLIAEWNTPAEKVTVLPCGVNPSFRPITDPQLLAAIRSRYGLGDGPFVLSVGTLQPRKNYVRLIRAFAPLATRYSDLSLVIGGGKGWRYNEIFEEPDRLGIKDRVIFPGFIADDDLPAVYCSATIFTYPSLYEGFGMPVLEAMACGTPVVTSDRSSLPEVSGDAGLLVNPLDEKAMTASMERLLANPSLCQELIIRGRRQASRFSWGRAAEQLLEVYDWLLDE